MKLLRNIAYALVIIGALNWGLVGFFNFDLVAKVFGEMTVLTRVIYSLVGVSGIIAALTAHHCETTEEYETCEYGRCR